MPLINSATVCPSIAFCGALLLVADRVDLIHEDQARRESNNLVEMFRMLFSLSPDVSPTGIAEESGMKDIPTSSSDLVRQHPITAPGGTVEQGPTIAVSALVAVMCAIPLVLAAVWQRERRNC